MSQKVSSLAIDINVTGAPQASAQLKEVEKSGRQLTDRLQKLVTGNADYVAGLAVAAVAIKKIADAGDQYAKIANRIALVTETSAQAADVQSKLFGLAQRTGTAMSDVADQYSKIALAAKDLGASQADILRVVESVNKSLQVSGSSAAAAAGSSTQFVQALASGKLQAEELNSILDGNSFLATQIALGLGLGGNGKQGALGALREAVKEGRVLGDDVLGAVLRRGVAIDERFSKLGDTMERSGTRLQNSWTAALAAIDNKIGASRTLSVLFESISATLDGRESILGGSANASGGGAAYTAGFIPNRAAPAPARRPMVGRAGQLAPVRVTASRPTLSPPRPRTGAGGDTASRVGSVGTSGLLGNTTGGVGRLARSMQLSGSRGPLSGVDGGIGDSVALIGANLEQSIGPLAERVATLGNSVGMTLADSIANGITAAVQSGSIGAGFAELGRTLIGGLGAAVRDFGIQGLAASALMVKLKTALAAFSPIAGVAASVGLIALGSAMVGLAGRGARSSFGTTNTGIDRGVTAPQTITTAGSLSSTIFGGGATAPSSVTGQVTGGGNLVSMNVTVIGPNDPTAQRQIGELMRNAAARGAI